MSKPFKNISILFLYSVLLISGCGNNEDTEAPHIRFVAPTESDTVSSRLIVQLEVTDNEKIAEVSLFADNMLFGDSVLHKPPFEWLLITAAYPDGHTLTLRAEASDEAGNLAVPQMITVITDNEGIAPVGVDRFIISDTTKHSATLTWIPSPDLRFSHYEIMRSSRNTTTFTDTPVAVISAQQTALWKDQGIGESSYGLIDDSDYDYRIYVVTDDSLYSDSKTLRIHTKLPGIIQWHIPPVISRTKSDLTLSWSLTNEDVQDIDHFELRRIITPQDTIFNLTPEECLTGGSEYNYQDKNLSQRTLYYYQLRQQDKLGYYSLWNDGFSDTTLTFSYPLNGIVSPGKYSVTIAHSSYPYSDFDSYEYFVTDGSGSTPGTDAVPKLRTTSPDQTFHTIRALAQNSDYTLHIRLNDGFGNSYLESYPFHSDSLAKPRISIQDYGKYSATMTFSKYHPVDNDFSRYFIYRAKIFQAPTISTQGWSIYNLSDTTFTDETVEPDQIYYYFSAVIDTSGSFAFSDGAYILSKPVSLAIIDTVIVDENPLSNRILWGWQFDKDPDFQEFRLFRSKFSSLSGNYGQDSLIAQTTDTVYIDYEVKEFQSYRYMVRVVDDRGNTRNSPAVEINSNLPPPAVTLRADSVSHSDVYLSWDIPNVNDAPISDFREYRLFRSEYRGIIPDSIGTDLDVRIKLMHTTTSLMENHYHDAGLDEGNIYYYRLFVYDKGGEFQGSNEAEVVINP